MDVKNRQELELEITDIAFGGMGLAKVDGFAVFVDGTVPLDRVRARIFRKKKRYAEARLIEILSPSPHRRKAPCRYSGFCGGCRWQFIDYEMQLEYKRRHVSEAIEHIGLIKDVPVHPTLPSPVMYEYRNKMEFSCADRRWLLPDELGQTDIDTGFAVGLHVPGTFHKVLDISECLIQPRLGNDILDAVRTFIRASEMPVYGLKSHEGFWRFLMLRHSAARDQWMVNIITAEERRDVVYPLAERLMADYPAIVSIVNNITARRAGIAVGESEAPLLGGTAIRDRIGAFEFEISANSFFQTNTRGAESLYAVVKDYAGLSGDETVLDLYCGTGTIGITLSDAARSVTGIEIVESAVADARRNCRINGIRNCRFMAGDIRDLLSGIAVSPEVMVIDPPRVGMHKDVVRQVIELAPRKVVYVSCNPATLARDLTVMSEHYDIAEVQPVDMFPHTFHIESVARLIRK
ncbi:MAG: 23S rRNA (uracil(1939)-C(5))-methyltransferase RlmD [Desulfococcus multivorans]|jgi:23S rRNA (uracil1939-C5)-methyltransferase|uniref:23S rRNA (uracil(1939)-C(5))-methyltransferase RlmD n=1 Tax=Desulfococcus sp. TaxID=2025834 RepID=UPI002A3B1074|nr:23S rRNA (uracil(1939)-C(5))-methyltransferase RlmD [Desulfococcus multivorans]